MKSYKEQQIKIPFHPVVIIIFSLLFTFLAGGIIAGINWTRLSKPKWKYYTIGISVFAFIIYLYLYTYILQALDKFAFYVTYGIFASAGLAMYFIQKPYYDRWKNGD